MALMTVVQACEKEWSTWKGDCSGFVKAVAKDLNITLTGQANALIKTMGGDDWEQLETDADLAVERAGAGYFVVAGLAAKGHGHVVVIVPGIADPYPRGYWGRLGGTGKKNMSINFSWNKADLAKVEYFARKI